MTLKDNIFNDFTSSEKMKEFLKRFSDLDLASHYSFAEEANCTLSDPDSVAEFIKSTNTIKFRFNDDNTLYYSLNDDDEEMLFDIDVEKSFVTSNEWFYDKLLPVRAVFPNASFAELYGEMVSFFTCVVVASVFGGDFTISLLEVCESYDFRNWRPNDELGESFDDLSTSWVQLGSKYVKMVASAARYSLSREKKKIQVPSNLPLPEDVVTRLAKIERNVDNIRYEYDNIKLSAANRRNMSKLEIKNVVFERDQKIDAERKSDSSLYQIWRLLNLNSTNIPPTYLLKFNRQAKRYAIEQAANFRVGFPSTPEEKSIMKKIEDEYRKTARRAFLNKMFEEQCKKFVLSPSSYVAPDFV
jgi:hypothetical protein